MVAPEHGGGVGNARGRRGALIYAARARRGCLQGGRAGANNSLASGSNSHPLLWLFQRPRSTLPSPYFFSLGIVAVTYRICIGNDVLVAPERMSVFRSFPSRPSIILSSTLRTRVYENLTLLTNTEMFDRLFNLIRL